MGDKIALTLWRLAGFRDFQKKNT